jgi:Glycosyltransferase (GlcNAc)
MFRVSWVSVSVAIFVFVWFALFLSVFLPSDSPLPRTSESDTDTSGVLRERKLSVPLEANEAKSSVPSVRVNLRSQGGDKDQAVEGKVGGSTDSVNLPRRYNIDAINEEPVSLEEVRKNMTNYLHTLHERLASMAGPTVRAEAVWDAYLDVTTNMVMKWDDENRHRIPPQKNDNSIFVSLGTYRDPYCPMTIKSLYAQAAHPERLFVALLQQNCFEKKCRTGVLVGGRVEDMDTDVDCYKEFCKSPEGQRSGACLDERVRLFNVNESESLGPYMARYLGAKFYR